MNPLGSCFNPTKHQDYLTTFSLLWGFVKKKKVPHSHLTRNINRQKVRWPHFCSFSFFTSPDDSVHVRQAIPQHIFAQNQPEMTRWVEMKQQKKPPLLNILGGKKIVFTLADRNTRKLKTTSLYFSLSPKLCHRHQGVGGLFFFFFSVYISADNNVHKPS